MYVRLDNKKELSIADRDEAFVYQPAFIFGQNENMSNVIVAAKNGYKKKLDCLLAEGLSVHHRDEKQQTALFWGACRGHSGICESLIVAGAEIDARSVSGATPLHAAADTGQVECIKTLLKYGADINAQNHRGDTPLHLASYRGFTDVVSILLNSRADISLRNHQGKTPYVEADSQKHLAVLKILQPQMNKVIRQSVTEKAMVPPLTNIQYSTKCIHNSLNSSLTGSSVRSISFTRMKEPQENEDKVGSLNNPDYVSSDLNILSLDSQKNLSDLPDSDSQKSISFNQTEDTKLHKPWTLDSVDCKKSERQTDVKFLLLEMQRMRKSLKDQESFIQKLQTENEKLKEVAKLQEAERIRADDNSRLMAQQISRLKQPIQQVPLRSFSLSSSSSSCSFSPPSSAYVSTNVASPITHFPFPRFPPVFGSPTDSSSCSMDSESVHRHRDVSHKLVQEIYQELPDWKLVDFPLLTKKVSDVWLRVSEPDIVLEPNDQGVWTLGQNYELREKSPLNRSVEEAGSGTCSLVFQIKFQNHKLILKMMTNLIDLHHHGHNQGYSLHDSLNYRFGAELLPVDLPPHRNLIRIIHHYNGSTLQFLQYHPLVVPPNLDGIEMAHRTLFLVMPEYAHNLKSFMQTTCFNQSLETFLLQLLYQLLSAICLLETLNIVHRDIKPDNVFLDSGLRPILADFGFAKKMASFDERKVLVTDTNQIDAANNLAWTPEMIRWKASIDPLTDLTENDVYKFTDSYSIGKMFYSFLLTEGQKFPEVTALCPHYNKSDLPKLPSFLSPGLRYVLEQLVLNHPSERMTARQAMHWTGMLLFPPSPEEMAQEFMVKHYIQAKLMTLLVLKPTVFPSASNGPQMTVSESIQFNAQVLEADFLCNITINEFWQTFQSISILNSNLKNPNNSTLKQ